MCFEMDAYRRITARELAEELEMELRGVQGAPRLHLPKHFPPQLQARSMHARAQALHVRFQLPCCLAGVRLLRRCKTLMKSGASEQRCNITHGFSVNVPAGSVEGGGVCGQ